jgi:hypothetical protein
MPYLSVEDKQRSARAYYRRNKAKMKLRAAKFKTKARGRNAAFVREYLQSHPCVDCSNEDVRVLEFDHVRGEKDRAVATLANAPTSIARIEEEIAKCEVRCANCHRIRHAEERD